MRFLNRVISSDEHGLGLEADPRHPEIIVAQLGLHSASSVSTPSTPSRPTRSEDDATNPPLSADDTTACRAIAARCNFLAIDRADLQHATMEACRFMANPRKTDWELLGRIGRYLKERPRMVLRYEWQKGT